jgi:hypothetical protein
MSTGCHLAMNGGPFGYFPPTCQGTVVSDGELRVDLGLRQHVSLTGSSIAGRQDREKILWFWLAIRQDVGLGFGLLKNGSFFFGRPRASDFEEGLFSQVNPYRLAQKAQTPGPHNVAHGPVPTSTWRGSGGFWQTARWLLRTGPVSQPRGPS